MIGHRWDKHERCACLTERRHAASGHEYRIARGPWQAQKPVCTREYRRIVFGAGRPKGLSMIILAHIRENCVDALTFDGRSISGHVRTGRARFADGRWQLTQTGAEALAIWSVP